MYFVPLLFNESLNSKFTPWTNSRLSSFLHNILQWMRALMKQLVKFLLKSSNFEPIVCRLWLAHLKWTDIRYKDAILCSKFFPSTILVRTNCTQLHHTKFLTEQLIQLKLLNNKFSKSSQRQSIKLQNFGQKHNYWSGAGLSQKGPRFLHLMVVVTDIFTYINILFMIIHLSCGLNFSKVNLKKKIKSN